MVEISQIIKIISRVKSLLIQDIFPVHLGILSILLRCQNTSPHSLHHPSGFGQGVMYGKHCSERGRVQRVKLSRINDRKKIRRRDHGIRVTESIQPLSGAKAAWTKNTFDSLPGLKNFKSIELQEERRLLFSLVQPVLQNSSTFSFQ